MRGHGLARGHGVADVDQHALEGPGQPRLHGHAAARRQRARDFQGRFDAAPVAVTTATSTGGRRGLAGVAWAVAAGDRSCRDEPDRQRATTGKDLTIHESALRRAPTRRDTVRLRPEAGNERGGDAGPQAGDDRLEDIAGQQRRGLHRGPGGGTGRRPPARSARPR